MANENLIVDSDLGVEQKVMGLLACLAREQKARIDRLIGETKLSLLQLQLLHALSNAPEGTLTVTQLKSAMLDENPNVSRTLNKLVLMGFVTKRRRHEDQRRVLVSITEAGEHAHVAADERLLGMSTGLSEGELQQLYELLLKL